MFIKFSSRTYTRYQKKLKMDIKSRDRDLARLNGLLNDRIEAYEELYETKRRLLKQFNLPENFRYDARVNGYIYINPPCSVYGVVTHT